MNSNTFKMNNNNIHKFPNQNDHNNIQDEFIPLHKHENYQQIKRELTKIINQELDTHQLIDTLQWFA